MPRQLFSVCWLLAVSDLVAGATDLDQDVRTAERGYPHPPVAPREGWAATGRTGSRQEDGNEIFSQRRNFGIILLGDGK